MILMDTDVCVELLRGNKKVLAHRQHAVGDVAITFMTMGELFYGAERSSRPDHNVNLIECFLLSVDCIHSDREVMIRFGRLKADLVGGGLVLPDADLLIAATALVHCEYLVTGNKDHFSRIPGLRLANWIR
jgi:predicted nucleic acid-binding protein